jgi:hypothetical protein
MHPVVVDKQLSHYWTMPTFLFANQAHIFMYYIVMGYQFDQYDSYNSLLDKVLRESTIVDDDAPPLLTTKTTPTDMSVVNRIWNKPTTIAPGYSSRFAISRLGGRN